MPVYLGLLKVSGWEDGDFLKQQDMGSGESDKEGGEIEGDFVSIIQWRSLDPQEFKFLLFKLEKGS